MLVLIFILMVGWFRSFLTPLVVMAAIPFSLVGILPAHGLMGAFFTATSMIGFMAGAGIVVRNSIILVDFIELRLAEGMPLDEAVVDAGAVRFRPMLLTALAVVVGASVILADPIFQGLAISLDGGRNRLAAHQPHGGAGALLHGLPAQAQGQRAGARLSPHSASLPTRAAGGTLAATNMKSLCLISVLSVTIALGTCGAAAANATPRPNIAVILVDDMGFSDLGCYGSEIPTPNLDKLAAGGLRFTQFYNTGRCCPTRAALLTGLYSHQAGVGHMVTDRKQPGYQGNLNDRCVTIAEVLRGAGYRTAMAGKWHVTRFTEADQRSGEGELAPAERIRPLLRCYQRHGQLFPPRFVDPGE